MLRPPPPFSRTLAHLTAVAAIAASAAGCTYGTVYDTSNGAPIEDAVVDFLSASTTNTTTTLSLVTDPNTGETFNYFISPYSITSSAVDWAQSVPGPWALAVASADGYDRVAYPAEHDWLSADTCTTVHDNKWADRACIRRDLGLESESDNRIMLPDLVVRRSVVAGCSAVPVDGGTLIVPFSVSNLGEGPLEILAQTASPIAFQVMRKRTAGSAAQFVGEWHNFGILAPQFAVTGDSISVRLVNAGGTVLASSEQPLCARDAAVASAALLPGGALELGGLQDIADTFYGGSVAPFAAPDCTVNQTQGLFPSHSSGATALLDISSVPDGNYDLEVGINESGLFVERTLDNNVVVVPITLAGGVVTNGCQAGAPGVGSDGLF